MAKKTESTRLSAKELRQQKTTLCDGLSFAAAEAYKLLRTNVSFSFPAETTCPVIGVTSSIRGEGKSTTSVNLAYTLAQTGKRVLLVDGDMRLPTIAQKLDMAGTPGLSNLLAGLSAERNCLRKSSYFDNWYILPAGDIPPNPSELLGSERMHALLDRYKDVFDYILLDLPPVNIVVDALVITKWTDGVIVVNRVKLHTDFHGPHESGIVKMLTIGLGKHAQALAVHRYGANGLRDYIPRISRKVIESGKILGGVAILEDGYDHTADLVYAPADRMFEVDHALLERSRTLCAKLPFAQTDVLVVDAIGKNYSGTGMDTNVIGRIMIPGQEDLGPKCSRIVALDISNESHGNALGVGLADVISKRLDDKINWKSTYENVITSGFLARGNRPIVGETDRRAIEIALMCCGRPIEMRNARLARIPNTLHLGVIEVSRKLYEDIKDDPSVELISDFAPIAFDETGSLMPF